MAIVTAISVHGIGVYDLTCEHRINPVGLNQQEPRMSWKISSDGRNVRQSAYRIQVAFDVAFQHPVWDAGRQESDESVLVLYRGPGLESRQRYYWRVKVWDNNGIESKWSLPSFWEMGILDTQDWVAQWVEPDQQESPDGPALTLRKDFTVRGEVKRARLYASARGLYELHLGGGRVNENLFEPGWTSYDKRIQYQVYDVTDRLTAGKNVLGAIVGDGWYKGYMGLGTQWGVYGKKTSLLCQLMIEYSDGDTDIIASDASWKSTDKGPIRLNSIYNGEHYDARMELDGWCLPDYDDSGWVPVHALERGGSELVPSEGVPVRRIQELAPVRVWKADDGTWLADMGQNMVGWVRLQAKGQEGAVITLKHGEVLDESGNLYVENLRAAQATLRYIKKSSHPETYEPRFTFMGFRYVSVSGIDGELKPEDVTGVVIHSDMELTGTFESSHPLINQLQKNILWSQKGNFLDIPTDCPQRDERLGWTGDVQVFIGTAAYNMDVAAFFTKWLKDVIVEQFEDGSIPFVVPDALRNGETSAGWADVVTIAPWEMYKVYGDVKLLEQLYPSMRKYIEYIHRRADKDYIWRGGSVFGDWLFFRPEGRGRSVRDGFTNHDLIATAFFAHSTQLLVHAAEALGRDDDVIIYEEMLDRIKDSFIREYVTPGGRILSDSQTSYVLALMFDLLPDGVREKAVNHLVEDITKRGNHLTTGFLGTPYLCRVLSDNGRADVAYDLLLQEGYPSWLYPVKAGATTIWERWDGKRPDGTFQTRGMNSFNHYAYGAVGSWMYRVVAGIEPGTPGYRHILIRPQPDQRLGFAKATFESRYGRVESGWEVQDGEMTIKIVVPPNATASVTLPRGKLNAVTESGKSLAESDRNAREVEGNVEMELGSGMYVFRYPFEHDAK